VSVFKLFVLEPSGCIRRGCILWRISLWALCPLCSLWLVR